MTIAAAIRITSADDERLIRQAASFAAHTSVPCFMIAIVDELPYGRDAGDARDAVRRNLELIESLQATPVMQEGDDVAKALVTVASGFGVTTLFVRSGAGRRRSVAEEVIDLDPPFDVVVIAPG